MRNRRRPLPEDEPLDLVLNGIREREAGRVDLPRIAKRGKIYAAGLAFANAIQNKVEWLVLWQRVAGGFSTGQQRELAQRVIGELGLGGKKAARLNPQMERESWRLLASLERLDAAARARIGDELLDRVRRESGNASLLWAIGRLGARAPLYGPLSSVVPPRMPAMDRRAPGDQGDHAGGRGGHRADRGPRRRSTARPRSGAARACADESAPERHRRRSLRPLEEVMATSTFDASRVFGEPLPAGLRLDVAADAG